MRGNQDVKKLITCWCVENNDKRWSIGIKFVQFTKNLVYHNGIQQIPYKSLFGCDVKCGLNSNLIDKEILSTLKTEEELERTYREFLIKNNEDPDELFANLGTVQETFSSQTSSSSQTTLSPIEKFQLIEENRDLEQELDAIEATENALVITNKKTLIVQIQSEQKRKLLKKNR